MVRAIRMEKNKRCLCQVMGQIVREYFPVLSMHTMHIHQLYSLIFRICMNVVKKITCSTHKMILNTFSWQNFTNTVVTKCMGHLIPKLSMITLSVRFEPSKANQPRKSKRIVEFLLFCKCLCIVHFVISM